LEASPTKNFGLIFWFTNGNLCFWFCSLGKGELNQVEFTRSQALSTIENGGRRDASESARASRRTASKTRRDSGFDDTETGHRQGTARRTPFQKHPLMISDPWPTLELFFQQLPKIMNGVPSPCLTEYHCFLRIHRLFTLPSRLSDLYYCCLF